MPPNKPSSTVSQRRIFRGRGGPTDGNLPPKKTARVKVKYQHNHADGTSARADDDASDHVDEVDINQLSLGINNDDDKSAANDGDDDMQNPLHKEIHHLQKRIENITLSIQASPLGISNPNTWRTNCLNPIKNVIKEWRSILSFHSASEIIEREGNNDGEHAELQKLLLHETSTKVFILVQMSMQSGPLVGSNPGYFKRCGAEVASIALDFLNDVIDLAGVEAPADEDDGNPDELKTDEDNDDVKEEAFSTNSSNDGSGSDDSISTAADDDEDIKDESDSETRLQSVNNLTVEEAAATTQTKEFLIIQSLQHSFLFTEKQSMRLYQWRRNAQKASDSKKLPSKSASKLQGQKSKKQKQKELRMERKLKKKDKGGGRK